MTKKVLLYSGGMDSWLIDKLWKPDLRLYVDIKGSYSEEEKKRLPKDTLIVPLPLGQFEQPDFIVPLRNLYFFLVASNYGEYLCLGATLGDNHRDKTEHFFCQTESLLCYLWGPQSKQPIGRTITIERKFLFRSKIDLVRSFVDNGGNLNDVANKTFSCYSPISEQECLACKPCFRKYVALSINGYQYPKDDRYRMWKFVRKEIVPRARNLDQTYYTERAGEGQAAAIVVKDLYREFGGSIEEDEACIK